MMQQAYLELKLAWELYKKSPEQLAEPEKVKLQAIANRQSKIEQRILSSHESAQVVIPATTLATRLAEIRQRYDNDAAYQQDLENIGLNSHTLAGVVEHELRIEATLEKIGAAVPNTTLVDAEIYYRLHPQRFDRPEARRLRHILITYSNQNEQRKAQGTLENLRSTVKNAENFAQAALRHSQCPTAMEGGILGTVQRGQLYSELEPCAFALAEGEISPVTCSPVGLHILYCDEIFPHGVQPFEEVSLRIIERLTDQRRQQAQRDWIKALFSTPTP